MSFGGRDVLLSYTRLTHSHNDPSSRSFEIILNLFVLWMKNFALTYVVTLQAQMRHGIEAQMRELAEELEMEKQGLDLASAQIEQAEGQMMVLNNKVEALEGHVRIERARVAELTEELDAERKRGSQASTAERKAICATNRLVQPVVGEWALCKGFALLLASNAQWGDSELCLLVFQALRGCRHLAG